jgi:hypothetical protein
MKAAFSLMALGLASIVAATDYEHTPPPYDTVYVPGKPEYESTTVYVTSTSTSLCPVTTTIYEGGHTITKVYTSTSTIYTKVPTVIYQTVHKPDQTTHVVEQVTITSTSLCPVYETKTVGGGVVTNTYTSTSTFVTVIPKTDYLTTTLAPQTTNVVTYDYETHTSYCPVTLIETVAGKPVTVIHTSTSLIVEKVEKTIVKTHVVETTEYLTSLVHETIKTVETEYTTVEAGSTITIATTLKNTVLATDEYTVTKTLEPPTTKATIYQPITLETSVPVTQVVTLPSEVTVYLPGTTSYESVEVPTTLTTVPTLTVTSVAPQNTTSAPLQISDNAAPTNKPIALAMAGGMALLAALA